MKLKPGDFIENEKKELGFITSMDKEGFVVEWQKYQGTEQFHYHEDAGGWMLSLRSFVKKTNVRGTICLHIWVKYEGFTEAYDFCKNCGAKDK